MDFAHTGLLSPEDLIVDSTPKWGDEIKNMLYIIKQSHLEYSLELFCIKTQIFYIHESRHNLESSKRKKKKFFKT